MLWDNKFIKVSLFKFYICSLFISMILVLYLLVCYFNCYNVQYLHLDCILANNKGVFDFSIK